MSETDAAVLRQIDNVLKRCGASGNQLPGWNYYNELGSVEITAMSTSIAALVRRIAPGSVHDDLVTQAVADDQVWNVSTITTLVGVVAALRLDVEAGFTEALKELVHAEVFEDFLSMASELLDKSFAAPAAVLAGSVLEEHLRKLAVKNGVEPVHSVEELGVLLRKRDVFVESQRKIVAGWYGVRTDAAHGRHANVVAGDVQRMIDGIREFAVRYPA